MPTASASRPSFVPGNRPVITRAALVVAMCCAWVVCGVSRAAPAPADAPPPAGGAVAGAASRAAAAPVRALRLRESVTVDGTLSEAAWRVEPSIAGLTQSEPDEGAPPTQATAVWIAYDDDALYVAARLSDSSPDSIVANLVRRDRKVASDRFVVYLDSYRDRRGGSFFSVSAAGVQWDGSLFNDGETDDTWDGVWEGRARRDRQGWTCEMRIPFSQLRYRAGAEQVWGVNVSRRIERRAEMDQLVHTPKTGSGFSSRFPDLTGLVIGRGQRRVELLPYVTNKAEFLVHAPGDPFNDGSRQVPAMGADARAAIGNHLALNATVNPDFGQVEVDPAVVNLSDVESFFEEKRPFFTENSRAFSFGREGANAYPSFAWAEPTFFYTRRLGRAPQGRVPAGAEYSDVPIATRILGAGKLTGKLTPNLDFGSLLAVTSREEARFAMGPALSKAVVEPLALYGVTRGLGQFAGGASGLGAMTTVVERRPHDPALASALNRESLFGGIDGWHLLDARHVWVLSGWAAASRLAGSRERMIAVQSSPRRYMQRPDSRHLGVDSAATSLAGYGMHLWLNKQQGSVLFNSAVGYMNPRFDVSDAGFQSFADELAMHVRVGYHFTRPSAWRKDATVTSAVFRTYNTDHDLLNAGVYSTGAVTFADDFSASLVWWYVPLTFNPRRARGGPVMAELPGNFNSITLSTPDRSSEVFSLYAERTYTPGAGRTDYWTLSPTVTWKPASNVSLQVGPALARAVEDAQYVTTVVDPTNTAPGMGGRRYVFARMYQTTVAADVRFDLTLTPKLSLQTFLQPLSSAANYTGFKELARDRSFEFRRYGMDGGSTWDPATGIADPDGAGPAPPIAIGNPSFSLRSLRGSAVLRWEYRPGSTLFLVWTQERSDQDALGEFRLSSSMHRLLDLRANDIFVVKATYDIGL